MSRRLCTLLVVAGSVSCTGRLDVSLPGPVTEGQIEPVTVATSLTKASIMDAIAKRRVYATSDHNAQIVFTLKDSAGVTHYMGEGYSRTAGPVATSGPVTLHVSHFDPDGDAVSSIKIFEPVPGNAAGEATL